MEEIVVDIVGKSKEKIEHFEKDLRIKFTRLKSKNGNIDLNYLNLEHEIKKIAIKVIDWCENMLIDANLSSEISQIELICPKIVEEFLYLTLCCEE